MFCHYIIWREPCKKNIDNVCRDNIQEIMSRSMDTADINFKTASLLNNTNYKQGARDL